MRDGLSVFGGALSFAGITGVARESSERPRKTAAVQWVCWSGDRWQRRHTFRHGARLEGGEGEAAAGAGQLPLIPDTAADPATHTVSQAGRQAPSNGPDTLHGAYASLTLNGRIADWADSGAHTRHSAVSVWHSVAPTRCLAYDRRLLNGTSRIHFPPR